MAKQGQLLVSGAEVNNLPSYGLSNYVNLASGEETLKMLKNIGAGKSPTGRATAETAPFPGLSSKNSLTIASGSNNQDIQVIVQNDDESEHQEPSEYGFKFAAATAPITSTVDASQIMETETSGAGDFGMTAHPQLKVRLLANYMRFRYMSEKCPKKKGSKTRNYEVDDVDKNSLAEVWMENYEGVGKIVAYCVDGSGKLHPYNLFGEGCHRGVYVHKYKFRKNKRAKLHKVTVTTPKAKEYKENLDRQLSYLGEAGIQDIKFCSPDEIQDKQIVYIMFKVILDECDGEIVSQISSPLQNKKKGKEFLIDDIEPVSCPANIPATYNAWKYRVMLHVTEGTAFPSEVGLKIREKDSSGSTVWEAEPAKENIKTVKQCVVKFIPPPYRDPDIKKDVEVQICLYDKVTKNETDPFSFTYLGSDNVKPEMKVENKAKKRKLTDDIDITNLPFVPEDHLLGERKTLRALHSRHDSTSSSSGSVTGNSDADNSLPYQETQSRQSSMTEFQNQSSNTPTGAEDEGVSIRQNKPGQVPFQNYTGQNLGNVENQPIRPQSAGFRGQMSGEIGVQASSNQSSIVTSTTSVFCTTTESTSYQTASSNMSTMSVSSKHDNSSHLQQQPMLEEQPSQMMILSKEDQQVFQQQGVALPKLGPNQMLAFIGGQIYVVNDDTAEQASITPPPAAINPPSAVQNIGQHQVVIQQVATQQPASEADQMQGELSSAIIQGSPYQTMINDVTQSIGNPVASTSTHTAVDQSVVLQQNLLLQQQNLLLQQQTLQQQQGLQQQGLQQQGLQQQQQQGLQQQQQQQQQQVLQQLAQVAAENGLDINAPGVLQALLQQAYAIHGQVAMQQGAVINNSTAGLTLGAGTDLNDDDLEEDGGISGGKANGSKLSGGKASSGKASGGKASSGKASSGKASGGKASDRNTSERRVNKPKGVKNVNGQGNKKLRGSSGRGKAMYEEEEMEFVEGQVDEDSNIPVFVNEVTVGEESNDTDSYHRVQVGNAAHFVLKNGSFGNDIYSEDDEESR